MNRLFGVLLILLAGCAVAPEVQPAGAKTATPPPPAARHAARVGVEYLPAEPAAELGRRYAPALSPGAPSRPLTGATSARPEPRAEAAHEPAPAPRRAGRTGETRREIVEPWGLSDAEIREIPRPFERFTVQFVKDVLGEDRRRVQRHLGAPLLFHRSRHSASDPVRRTHLDGYEIEDHELRLSRESHRLLRKPFRKALRDATVVHDVEVWFDDVKAETLPLTAGSERGDGDAGSGHGRVSVRVRASDFENPLGLTYVRAGWRIGGDAERLKVTYSHDLSESVEVSVRTRYEYDSRRFDLWADLLWRAGESTGVHLLMGNKVDLTSGGTLFPLLQSPVVLTSQEESPGLLFYVQHMF